MNIINRYTTLLITFAFTLISCGEGDLTTIELNVLLTPKTVNAATAYDNPFTQKNHNFFGLTADENEKYCCLLSQAIVTNNANTNKQHDWLHIFPTIAGNSILEKLKSINNRVSYKDKKKQVFNDLCFPSTVPLSFFIDQNGTIKPNITITTQEVMGTGYILKINTSIHPKAQNIIFAYTTKGKLYYKLKCIFALLVLVAASLYAVDKSYGLKNIFKIV